MEHAVLKLTFASVFALGLFLFETYRLKSMHLTFKKHPIVILVVLTGFLFAWAFIRS